MKTVLLLITVFRMIVLPVGFEDRELSETREERQAFVQAAQDYFNRQFDGSGTSFQFTLAPDLTLSHPVAWYGANYPDKRDIRLPDAVREACNLADPGIDFSDIDHLFLLYAGPGEHESGDENDLYPQQGSLTPQLILDGRRIGSFAAGPEGRLGVFCHELAHILGLPDLYDTDGEESGGRTDAFRGTSLMDEGCRQETVPPFGALEYELLGLGRCDTLAVGHYTLAPLQTGRRYLKALTDREDEFFLFEARDGGLWVSHIDRSDNPAGASPRHEAPLTARERWEYGEVNNNPDHPCARLVPADPDTPGAAGVPFPGKGNANFGSDSPAPFRFWSGLSSGFALTGIRPDGSGGVSFDVLEPLVLTDLSVFQDAAVVRWKPDPALEGIRSYEVEWTDGGRTERRELPADAVSCTVEGLRPQTAYLFSVQVRLAGEVRYSVNGSFVTKVQRGGTYPYIYLSGATRNVDGSFPAGSKIPLRVFNATEVEAVEWTLDGERIAAEADGRYTLRHSGVLRARIIHSDGTSETLLKVIIVQ